MKTLLSLIVCALLLAGCTKSGNPTAANAPVSYYLTATINGQPWAADTIKTDIGVATGNNYNEQIIFIEGTDANTSRFSIGIVDELGDGRYFRYSHFSGSTDSKNFYTISNSGDSVHATKINDTTISGTFSGMFTNQDPESKNNPPPDTITITNGRFYAHGRLHY